MKVITVAFVALGLASIQSPTGTITGRTLDGVGVVPGVTITATIGSDTRRQVSNARGEYTFASLPPGHYRLEVKMSGFMTQAIERVEVWAGASLTWNPILHPVAALLPNPLPDVRMRVERVTGPDPIDCGLHVPRAGETVTLEQLKGSLDCATQAISQRKTFWTLRVVYGVDSTGFQGLLGTKDGTLHRFSYDSQPCGGPSCAPSFVVARCPGPSVTVANGQSVFECEP